MKRDISKEKRGERNKVKMINENIEDEKKKKGKMEEENDEIGKTKRDEKRRHDGKRGR